MTEPLGWNRIGAALLALAMVCAGRPALAADGETATSEALIIPRLSLVNDGGLDFGDIVAGPGLGTVTVSPANVVTSTGGATPIGGTSPALFHGYGAYNQIVSLWLGANQITLVRAGGGATMQVNTFTVNSTPPTTLSTTPRYFRIGAPNGYFSFNVGGTLRVGANQMPGTYNGSFTVTVEYY